MIRQALASRSWWMGLTLIGTMLMNDGVRSNCAHQPQNWKWSGQMYPPKSPLGTIVSVKPTHAASSSSDSNSWNLIPLATKRSALVDASSTPEPSGRTYAARHASHSCRISCALLLDIQTSPRTVPRGANDVPIIPAGLGTVPSLSRSSHGGRRRSSGSSCFHLLRSPLITDSLMGTDAVACLCPQ